MSNHIENVITNSEHQNSLTSLKLPDYTKNSIISAFNRPETKNAIIHALSQELGVVNLGNDIKLIKNYIDKNKDYSVIKIRLTEGLVRAKRLIDTIDGLSGIEEISDSEYSKQLIESTDKVRAQIKLAEEFFKNHRSSS